MQSLSVCAGMTALECAGMTELWIRATCRPVTGQRKADTLSEEISRHTLRRPLMRTELSKFRRGFR